MGKRILCLVLALLPALSLTGCHRDEEAERTPDIDFYIQFASEKFGVPEEEISVVEYEKATTGVTNRSVWITPLEEYTIPPRRSPGVGRQDGHLRLLALWGLL